jgi:hypothetical protein
VRARYPIIDAQITGEAIQRADRTDGKKKSRRNSRHGKDSGTPPCLLGEDSR